MDELTTPRIEPLAPSVDLDQRSSHKESPRKREIPDKPSPVPSVSVESDDPVERIHQVDELA